MFHPTDLALRRAAALLPSRAGYALTQRLTPHLGGEARAWIGSQVEASALSLLENETAARAAGERFVAEVACDDLDALTADRWPEARRLAATRLVGEANLPTVGPAIVTSFHFSGGFRIFDVLRARGLRPTFLHAPPRGELRGYDAALYEARTRYFESHLEPRFIEPGPGARDSLDEHLGAGGVIVALLDVAPAVLDLRDHAECRLFGRPLRLPVGLLRLAVKHDAPVLPYDGRIEAGARVLEIHPAMRAPDPAVLLQEVLRGCERVIRERPWTWQSWLDAASLFENAKAG